MVASFKDSLNLPRTAFPMRANLAANEPALFARWDASRLYDRIIEAREDAPAFVLHDGPPFTNGDVHIGTALNKIPKDIILRYKSMHGFRTPYVPGWDCHGLPIEHKVAVQLRQEKKQLSTSEMREACADFSRRFIEKQRAQFKRLGILADWKNEYRTMDPAYEAEIIRTFAIFVEKGLVYRAKKPVYWSIPCETALAEAEIEYRDHVSPSIWVRFPVADPGVFDLSAQVSVVIWTTTPWTLPANLAVAVHPRIEYAFVASPSGTYVVATELVERFVNECGISDHEIVRSVLGAELEGLQTKHPFIDRLSPIVLAEYVTTEAGTGCVHTAPGHGPDDHQTGLRYNLEPYCPLDDQGRFIEDGSVPRPLVGVSVLETEKGCPANDVVLSLLRSTGTLLQEKRLRHSYPHCWRSKTPVIFRAMDQWFVAIDSDGVRTDALQALRTVIWEPDWAEARIRGTIENRPDWCISRQRSWGVPIPVFYDGDRNPYLDASVIRALADKIEKHGSQFWFDNDTASILDGIAQPTDWSGKNLLKGTDTLDVWIDSGVSHLAVLKKRSDLHWPADLYFEGSDQHRGWFQSSLLTSIIATRQAPYKGVITHGFVVGQDGKKISKSDGKPLTADYYVQKFGSDIIRLWVASIDFRNDVPISDEILNIIADTYRTLRNTLRFQIGNLYDFDSARDCIAPEALEPLDQWALDQTSELVESVSAAYGEYAFHRAYQLINRYCTVVLSATYHDCLKDRLYTLRSDGTARRSAQTAIARIFDILVRLLAPILVYTCDEAYTAAQRESGDPDQDDPSVHLRDWPKPEEAGRFPTARKSIDRVLRVRDLVNERLEKLRQEKLIGQSLDAQLEISGNPTISGWDALRTLETSLPELFIVSSVKLTEQTDISDFLIEAKPAEGPQCPRCWRRVPVLAESAAGHICPRCNDALA